VADGGGHGSSRKRCGAISVASTIAQAHAHGSIARQARPCAAQIERDFFATKKLKLSFDSTFTGTRRHHDSTDDLIKDNTTGRVWRGMHFRTSNEHGAGYSTAGLPPPIGASDTPCCEC
jgi:hypothetical protein